MHLPRLQNKAFIKLIDLHLLVVCWRRSNNLYQLFDRFLSLRVCDYPFELRSYFDNPAVCLDFVFRQDM